MRAVMKQELGSKTCRPCTTERAVNEMMYWAHDSVIDVNHQVEDFLRCACAMPIQPRDEMDLCECSVQMRQMYLPR